MFCRTIFFLVRDHQIILFVLERIFQIHSRMALKHKIKALNEKIRQPKLNTVYTEKRLK